MQTLTLPDIKDIKDIIVIPDSSFYLFILSCVIIFIIVLFFIFYFYKYYIKQRYNIRKKYFIEFKNLLNTLENKKSKQLAKNLSYTLTKYLHLLAKTQEEEVLKNILIEDLSKYKYIKDDKVLTSHTKLKLKEFLGTLRV